MRSSIGERVSLGLGCLRLDSTVLFDGDGQSRRSSLFVHIHSVYSVHITYVCICIYILYNVFTLRWDYGK